MSQHVAVLSANLGGYDDPMPYAPQNWLNYSVHRFTDATLPPRSKAMTPALQCGLPKWFGPEFVPGADLYLWVDASCALLETRCVSNWVHRLGSAELVVFAHPDRSSIRDEYEFIKGRLSRPGERYLTSRYAGEWLDEQYARIASDQGFEDRRLFATTAFMYRPTPAVRALFKEVWFGKTRYHLHDQLWFTYALAKADVVYRVIPEKYTDCHELLTYVRNWKRKTA